MQTEEVDTIIIGGGLSGIYAAFLLAARAKSLALLEARSRLGGRILSPEHQGFFLIWAHPGIGPCSTQYQDGAKEEFTATEYDQRAAHNHPEFQPPSGKTSIWDGMLHFAGSETADHFGGHLEGALASAERAVSAAI
ncbi:MAG: NAD(P)-binding protein [Desulfobacterales bacterium]|nr:NAD(P)-binding protein [Desulfobacterales bacterium]